MSVRMIDSYRRWEQFQILSQAQAVPRAWTRESPGAGAWPVLTSSPLTRPVSIRQHWSDNRVTRNLASFTATPPQPRGDVLWWEIRKFYYPFTDPGVWLEFFPMPETEMINWYPNKESWIWNQDGHFQPPSLILPCCQFHHFPTEDESVDLQRVLKPHRWANSHHGI